MKNKLILVGKNARKAANIKISKKIKNKVLNDY